MAGRVRTVLAATAVVSAALLASPPIASSQRTVPPKMDAKCLPPRIPAMESMILLQDRLIRAPLEGFGVDHMDTTVVVQRALALKVGENRSGQDAWRHRVYLFFFVPSNTDSSEDREFILAAVNDRLVTGEDLPWIDTGVVDYLGHLRASRFQSCLWIRQDRHRELPEPESPDDASGKKI